MQKRTKLVSIKTKPLNRQIRVPYSTPLVVNRGRCEQLYQKMSENLIVFIFVMIYFSPVYYHLYFAIKESKKDNKKYPQKIKKVLKWSFIILLPIIGLVILLSYTNYLDYEKPLTYDKVDKITFKNFRGIELFKKSLYGNERFAYVYTSIETKFESDSLLIQSFFHPSKSFVYKKNTNSQELLNHEIFHFKITELYVRKLKEKISSLHHPSHKQISKIIDDLMAKENSFQEKYDYDTFHSYVFSEQKRYEKLIDSSLNSLKKYSIPKIYLNEID